MNKLDIYIQDIRDRELEIMLKKFEKENPELVADIEYQAKKEIADELFKHLQDKMCWINKCRTTHL